MHDYISSAYVLKNISIRVDISIKVMPLFIVIVDKIDRRNEGYLNESRS